MSAYIHSLYYYPIKSCAGIRLEHAKLTLFGLQNDRQWMIIDTDGKMLTQRKIPALALVQPVLHNDILTLSHPSAAPIKASLDGSSTAVSIWGDQVTALAASKAVNDWLTHCLQSPSPLRLVKYDSSKLRQPGQPERFAYTAKHFADAAPFLIANIASLDKLNSHLSSLSIPIVSMLNFRPNIVIAGIDAFEEHNIQKITLKNTNTELKLIDYCQRCAIITIDPTTAQRREKATPLKQLVELNAMPDNTKAPAFGVNAVLGAAQKITPVIISENDRITTCMHRDS